MQHIFTFFAGFERKGKIKPMPESKNFPSLDRISVLAAAILLVFTLAGFINIPQREINLQLPGVFLNFQIDTQVVVALLVAGLTATGADWLIKTHPKFDGGLSIQHWFLPALTAWTIGTVLFQQPFGILRWAVFGIGSATLILVLIAEYMVVDPGDTQHIPALIWIISISYALFLILTITIRANEARLFFSIPTITVAFILASLRTSYLRLQTWAFRPILIIALVIGQISSALHYLPVGPVTFGLILLGPAFALNSFVGGLVDKRPLRQVVIEPIVVLSIVWGIALIFR
jgi:hypothetical protein